MRPRSSVQCAIAALVILLGLLACAGDRPIRPEGAGIRLSILRPAPGDSLADTIRCVVRIDGGRGRSARLAAGDSLVAECESPPWILRWLPGGAGSRRIDLEASAFDSAGRVASSGIVTVRWGPNRPPSVYFPDRTSPAWIARAEAESLRVTAVDPEDGALPDSALFWHSDRQGFLGQGARIPSLSLTPGRHRIRVRATDRWLRAAWATLEVEAFGYRGASTPEGCLEDLRYSLLDQRPDLYEASLAAEFSFRFCPGERGADPRIPLRWDRDEEASFARHATQTPYPRFQRLEWNIASLERAGFTGGSWIKAELGGMAIRLALAPGETLAVSGGRARIYLRRANGQEDWRVVEWRDLGTRKGLSQGRLRIEAAVRLFGNRATTDPP